MKKSDLPDIKEFVDYRKYLRNVYEHLKATQYRFSYQSYTDLLNLGNRSFIQNIVRGEKSLPLDRVPDIAKGLKFTEDEKDYFELLIRFSEEERANFKEKLWNQIRQRQSTVIAKELEGSQLELFEKWHTIAIMELIGQGFSHPRLMGRRLLPHVPVAEVRKDLDKLIRLGCIKQNDDGSYTQLETQLIVPPQNDFRVETMRSFQSKMMDLAKDSLAIIPPQERWVQTVTTTLSQENFDRLLAKQKEILNLIQEMGNEDQGESARIYQVNLGYFPISIQMNQKPGE